MTDNIIRLNYQQYRAVRRLVHNCCNYENGSCLLLDDGEECVYPQSITYSLNCKWFRAAVLPADKGLCAALLHQGQARPCAECGTMFVPRSNRGEILRRVRRHRASEAESRKRARAPQAWTFRVLKPLWRKGFPTALKGGADTFPFSLPCDRQNVAEVDNL